MGCEYMNKSLYVLLKEEVMIPDFLIKKITNTLMLKLPLSEEEYDFVYDKTMEFLQKTGFDEAYKLTQKGKIIENFLDMLFDLHKKLPDRS